MLLKSPKLPGANFSAARQFDPRSSIDIASITLARSHVSLSSGDEVPHILTRNSRPRSGEFLITSAKRLFQQHRPKAVNQPPILLWCTNTASHSMMWQGAVPGLRGRTREATQVHYASRRRGYWHW